MTRGLSMHRGGCADPRRQGAIVGVTAGLDPTSGRVSAFLDLLDPDPPGPSHARIPLNFTGHGLALNPRRSCEAVLLEKRGAGGCSLDLAARRVVRALTPLPGHAFYGHAAYSADAAWVFVIEAEAESGKGVISVRDARDLTVVQRLPTHGHAPHDCRLVDDGRALAVTNGGGPVSSDHRASVAVIDLGSGALLEEHALDDPNRNAGHLAVSADGSLAVVSAPRDGLPSGPLPAVSP